MSLADPLTSQFFSEAACPARGQKRSPPRGVGLRALQFLRGEFPNPWPPKMVARMIRQGSEATRKALQRMSGRFVVAVPGRMYRAMADAQLLRRIGLEPYKVHGLQFRLVSPNGGSPPALAGLGSARSTADGQEVRHAEALGRRVVVQAGGLVSVRASTEPFTVPEFAELAAWLEGLAGGGRVDVLSMDVNVDVENHRLRVSGAESISLQAARAGLWKVYNKRVIAATRIEACVHRVDMSLQEVSRVLQEFTSPPLDLPSPPSDGWEVA